MSRLMTRRSVSLATVALASAAATPARADESLTKARRDGLALGFSNEPPFNFLGPDGRPGGTSVEMSMMVLAHLGITSIRPVVTEFASLIPGLKANRIDLVTPIFILPARCREVAFSNPTTKTDAAMLVRKGNPKGIHSYEDAARMSNVTVAVMAGAAEHGYARRAGIPDERILPLTDPTSMLAAVRSGRADAAALTPPSVRSMAERGGGDVEPATPFNTAPWAIAYSGMPIRREDAALREAINGALKQVVGTPPWMAILAKLGRGEEVLPGNETAEAQCART